MGLRLLPQRAIVDLRYVFHFSFYRGQRLHVLESVIGGWHPTRWINTDEGWSMGFHEANEDHERDTSRETQGLSKHLQERLVA